MYIRQILLATLILSSSNTIANSESPTRVDVLAIEYHPFTTIKEATGGIAFELLNRKTKSSNIKWRPEFVPPKRAYQMINEQDWCASFYPIPDTQASNILELSDYSVAIGLVRKKQNTRFNWQTLGEFSGQSIALLRTGQDSPFAQQFVNSELNIVFVDSIYAAVQMVVLGRVELAMFDNYSFNQLEVNTRADLQFSETSLMKTQVKLYTNPNCDLPEIKKPIE